METASCRQGTPRHCPDGGRAQSTGRLSPSMLAGHGADNEPAWFTEHPAPPLQPGARRLPGGATSCPVSSQGRGQPEPGPRVAQPEPRPAWAEEARWVLPHRCWPPLPGHGGLDRVGCQRVVTAGAGSHPGAGRTASLPFGVPSKR